MRRSILLPAFVAAALLLGPLSPASAQDPADAEEVDSLLARAMTLHNAGDLLGAIQNYQLALEMAPGRADIRSNLGAAYVRLGRIDEGTAEYRQALEAGEDPTIRFNLGLALYKAGRAGDAIPELQQVLATDPDHRPAALLLGDSLLQAGRDEEVLDLLIPREDSFDDDLAYAYVLGTALLRQGDQRRGQVLIDRIFSRGESAEGYLLMGLLHLSRGAYIEAAKELERAVELNPELPTAQSLHGRAVLNTGNREVATRAFRRALEQNPDDFDANLHLGNIYRLERRYDDAMLLLRRAEAARPDHPAVRHGLAAALLSTGEAEQALILLEGLVRDLPDYVDAHVLLGTTYYRLQRKEDGDRQREIIERLNAEAQAKQPGARASDAAAQPATEPSPQED